MEQKNIDISSLNRYGSGKFGTGWWLGVGAGAVVVALIVTLIALDNS